MFVGPVEQVFLGCLLDVIYFLKKKIGCVFDVVGMSFGCFWVVFCIPFGCLLGICFYFVCIFWIFLG